MIVHATLKLAPGLGPDQLRAAGRVAAWWAERCRGGVAHVDSRALAALKAGDRVDEIRVEVELDLEHVARAAHALGLLRRAGRCRWLFVRAAFVDEGALRCAG